MPHLKQLTELRTLELGLTRITDTGIAEIGALHGLVELGLADTSLSDASVDTLEGLTALTDLDLTGTGVTDAGFERLADALPECTIRR
jgi:hypothetical protein